jgi:hypothetical protein
LHAFYLSSFLSYDGHVQFLPYYSQLISFPLFY